MIKAVIFDMDGTLVDSEPLWRQAFGKVFKPLGRKFNENHHVEMRGRSALENIEHLYAEKPWPGPPPQEVFDQIIAEMIKLFKTGLEPKKGVHGALQICKKHSWPVAIASGSPMVIINTVVDAVEIREHFRHIYSSQFEPYGKPHPGIFIKVAEHFGVPPAACLVFEDSPSGVLAAKAAKMKCIAVPEPEARDNPFVQTADIIIDSLEEFNEAMLAKLNR